VVASLEGESGEVEIESRIGALAGNEAAPPSTNSATMATLTRKVLERDTGADRVPSVVPPLSRGILTPLRRPLGASMGPDRRVHRSRGVTFITRTVLPRGSPREARGNREAQHRRVVGRS
jgi:hypothetical protein